MTQEADWNSHRLLIMDKLSTVHDDLSSMRDELSALRSQVQRLHEDVGGLKMKVAMWSAVVATVGTTVLHFWLGRLGK